MPVKRKYIFMILLQLIFFLVGTETSVAIRIGWLKNYGVLWEKSFSHCIATSPEIKDQHAFVLTCDMMLHCIDIRNGKDKWSRYVLGAGSISLHATEKRILVISNREVESKKRGHIYIYNINTGVFLWEIDIDGFIETIPVSMKDILFLGSGKGILYAIDIIKRKNIWKYHSKNMINNTICSSGDGIVFSNSNGLVYSIHATSGKVNWRNESRRSIKYGPSSCKNGIVVVDSNDNIELLSPDNGVGIWKERWARNIDAVAVSDSRIAVKDNEGNLYSINIDKKSIEWKMKTVENVHGDIEIANDVIYLDHCAESLRYSGMKMCFLYAIDCMSGDIDWMFRRSSTAINSPIVGDGVVIIENDANTIHAVPEKLGKSRFKINLKNNLITSHLSIDNDDTLYVSNGNGLLFAIDTKEGKIRWSKKIGMERTSSIGTGDEFIVLGDSVSKLILLRKKDGREIWKYDVGDKISTRPRIIKSIVLAACKGGYVFAVDLHSGKEKWKKRVSKEGIYTSRGGNDGYFYVLDYKKRMFLVDKEEKRVKEVDLRINDKNVTSFADVGDGLIVFGSNDGNLYGIGEKTSEVEWKIETKCKRWKEITVKDGEVYIGCSAEKDIDMLLSIELKNGNMKWKNEGEINGILSIGVEEKYVFIGTGDGYLVGFDKDSGNKKCEYQTRGTINADPLGWKNSIYFTSAGTLFALDIEEICNRDKKN